jgi:long-chain fatty acid transport protein
MSGKSFVSSAILALVLLPLMIAMPCFEVWAAGFEQNSNGAVALGRGGAFTAKANDLVAFEYNPAGLLKNKGTLIYLTGNLTDFNYKFTPNLVDSTGSPMDTHSVENQGGLFVAPFFAVSSDFLGDDWRVGFGAFGPNAVGRTSFPLQGSAEDSSGDWLSTNPHRYMMLDTDMLMVFYSLAVAWQPVDIWGVGVTLHWVDMINANIKMMVNSYYADDDTTYATGSSTDVAVDMNVSDRMGFAATIGTWVRPIKNLEVGLSARIPSVGMDAKGTMKLDFQGELIGNLYQSGVETGEGLVPFDVDGNQISELPVSLAMHLPIIARMGVRYVVPHGEDDELFDVEADVVWEGWSVMKNYEVNIDGYMQLVGTGVSSSEKQHFRTVLLEKNYKDTWSIRLGGAYRINDWLRVRAGGYYETGSVPEAYTNLDFASFDRLGAAAGMTFKIGELVDLSLAYSHIFQQQRVVSLEETEVYQSFPLAEGGPKDFHKVGAGTFDSSYDIFSFSAMFRL